MNKKTALVMLASVFLLIGCARAMGLRYTKPSFHVLDKGDIYVVVHDLRPPGRGGDNPAHVGKIRNSVGMPFPLKSRSDRTPPMVIDELVADCLRAAGYRVVKQSEGVPQIYALLKSFWSDGYQQNRMGMTMTLELKSDQNSVQVWSHFIESNVGATWTVGYGPMERGFTNMLEDVKQQLINQFNSPEFQRSYQST